MTIPAHPHPRGQRARHAWLSVFLGAALAVGIFAGPWLSRVRAETPAHGAGARFSAPERTPSALLGLRAGDSALAIERRPKTGGGDPDDHADCADRHEMAAPTRSGTQRIRLSSWTLPRIATLGPARTRGPPPMIA